MSRKVTAVVLCAVLLVVFLFCAVADDLAPDKGALQITGNEGENVNRDFFDGIKVTSDDPISRAVFLSALSKAVGADCESYPTDILPALYPDLYPDMQYADVISWAVCTGVADVFPAAAEGGFGPEEPVSREEAALCVSHFLVTAGYSEFSSTVLEKEMNNPLPMEFAPASDSMIYEIEGEMPQETETAERKTFGSAGSIEAAESAIRDLYHAYLAAEEEYIQNAMTEFETAPETQTDVVPDVPDTEVIPVPETTEAVPDETETPAEETVPETEETDVVPTEETEIQELLFADASEFSPDAIDAVEKLYTAGMFSNVQPDEFDLLYFNPQLPLTYVDTSDFLNAVCDYRASVIPPETVVCSAVLLNVDSWTLTEGSSFSLNAVVFPMDASNQHLIWYTEDTGVLSVDNGTVTALSAGQAEVSVLCANGKTSSCSITVEPAPVPEILDEVPVTYAEKCDFIYGRYLDDHRKAFSTEEEALANMTSILVHVWDFNDEGEKYTVTRWLTVHKNVAGFVGNIFDEIYALPEQPVIHTLGGFRWDGVCEHSVGLAIDINYYENYYCDPNGNAVVGGYFKPGEDPYSIPVGGSIDQIFEKYGFSRGINWRSGYKDYMHYSFFGW